MTKCFLKQALQLLLLTCLLTSTAQAEVTLDPDTYIKDLERGASLFFDPTSELSLDDISAAEYLFRFAPWQKNPLSLRKSDGNAWLRLPYLNDSDSLLNSMLRLQTPPGAHISIYKVVAGEKSILEESYKANNTRLYTLPITPQEAGLLFIQVPAAVVDKLQISLGSSEKIFKAQENSNWLGGWVIALFFMTVPFNFIFWLRYRHRLHLILSLFGMSTMFTLASWQEIPGKIIPILAPVSVQLFNLGVLATTLLIALGGRLLYGRKSRKLDYSFLAMALLSVLLAVPIFAGLPATEEYALILNFIACQSACYLGLFIRKQPAFAVPHWLTLPFAAIQLFCVLSILGIIPFNAFFSIWIMWNASALLLLCMSIYYSSPANILRIKASNYLDSEQPPTALADNQPFHRVFNTMGHELRTPLNGVLGMSELLLSTQLTPKQQSYVETLRYAGFELGNLINLLSDGWKLESEQLQLDEKPFDVHELLDDSLQKFRYRTEQLRSELISFVHPDVPQYSQSDTRRLSQVLEGVLAHACSQIDKGEIVVSVNHSNLLPNTHKQETASEGDSAGYLLFQVSYCHSASQQAKPELDVSLNLYLSIQLIEAMGGQMGQITQSSSHIWFAIPYKEYLAAPEPEEEPLSDFSDNNLRVLVVDDNKSCRQLLAQQCALLGLATMEAEGGREALGMIRNEAYLTRPFDAIILDHHMPGMNGMQVVERLNEDIQLEETPAVIMLTGATSPPGKQRAERLGISTILTKPVSRFTLQKALSQALNKKTVYQDA